MKAITIKPPWCQLIIHSGKDVENRDWPTRFRGRVAVHSSRRIDPDEYDGALALIRQENLAIELPSLTELKAQAGMILGTVEIVDCVTRSASPWFVGDYGFVLRNPIALAEPVFCRGMLNFWDVPPVILRLVEERLAKGGE